MIMLVGVGAAHDSGAHNRDLVPVRQATAQFHDVSAAEAAGYVNTGFCVPGMGYHFVNVALVDGGVDATQPEALVYAPTDTGLELVAVEYIAVNESGAPSLFGHEFEEAFFLGNDTYTLHAWVWKGNPDGLFHHTNPSVVCPAFERPPVEGEPVIED